MGDTWPYGPPAYVTWQAAFDWFANEGYPGSVAATFAAIGTAESSLDWRVVNNTPSTRDLSVGIWQINYFGNLYSGRVREFGTPQTLVEGGLSRQAFAALQLWKGRGQTWADWSTYNSGAYRKYLHGYTPPGGVTGGQEPTIQEGSTGAAVVILQTDLDLLGYGLATDGVFGPRTRAAVVAFQGSHGLATDGVVGPLTWGALQRAVGATQGPVQPGTPPSSSPPPPSEPPGNIDPSTVADWSSVVSAFGPELGADLSRLHSWGNAIGGIS